MRYSHGGAFREQVTVFRRQFLQDGGLPFTDVLTEEVIADALAAVVHRVADRPDRFEPRMAKSRPKRYDRLTRPRQEIKRQMIKGVVKI